jgi:hypothetical protein
MDVSAAYDVDSDPLAATVNDRGRWRRSFPAPATVQPRGRGIPLMHTARDARRADMDGPDAVGTGPLVTYVKLARIVDSSPRQEDRQELRYLA